MAGTVAVTDAPQRSRYEISIDGQLVGFADYRRRPGRLVLPHTEIDEEHRGGGLAARLVRTVLDAARAEELRVTPLCPYVADYIRRHPEYADLVDERYRGQLG